MSFDSKAHFEKIAALYRADEALCLERLFDLAQLPRPDRERATAHAERWVKEIRRTHKPHASITDLLSRFGLSSHEGLSLMCLAEALLRIPDRPTADALIRDKLGEADWNEALGENTPWTLNAAGWALAITGKIIAFDNPSNTSPGAAVGKLVSKLGQPVIREAIKAAMQWLADQFVTSETIEKALNKTEGTMVKGVRYSFDMLGEGARSNDDAEKYFQNYISAIEAIGQFQTKHNFKRFSGISVKLSAIHPRYEMVKRDRVLKELLPRLIHMTERAAHYNIPITIDAEEADRLQLSLELAAALFEHSTFAGWEGLGFAVQAYQKRAPAVVAFLVDMARSHKRRLHIRLVKGAYWDSEIKRAQERGWNDFPVYTRKPSTDVSYLACARQMIGSYDWIDPIFGTHNAMTVAHLAELAKSKARIEFQQLHGMSEELHSLMLREGFNCGIYAPVGNHDVLLGYLVRRILENGANSSFLHRLFDPKVPIKELTSDPVEDVRACSSLRSPYIQRASDLFKPERVNSMGLDLADPFVTQPLLEAIAKADTHSYEIDKTKSVSIAFEEALRAFPSWSSSTVDERSQVLMRLAQILEDNQPLLLSILVKEAKKTIVDAISEVREAVDFCRYYAARARLDLVTVILPGPTGERNYLSYRGRGIFVCLSPWNFPLAIFLGQISAAIIAGNCVIAKPAPQTPKIALCVQKFLYEAGLPSGVFHLCLGGTDNGETLIRHPFVAGVAFTGSTATANKINRALAAKEGPLVPLIAETGGQNALIVDSSALPEQVVDDVITSAFRSAGQRCSALRLLCLPHSTADKILAMLKGAMKELKIGDPIELDTDVGPVIDAAAQGRLLDHRELLNKEAKEIYTTPFGINQTSDTFVAPQAWEIPSVGWLKGEVFGPILHVVRYHAEHMDKLIAEINALGFGLTGGVHSRLDSTVKRIEQTLRVGNLYINRSLIGAVVGVQPFGGLGLSGTGPKAGGPHYLTRFAVEVAVSNNTTAAGGNASLMAATV